MSKKTCAVATCSRKVERFFKFPNPSVHFERLVKWIEMSGNSELLDLPPNKLQFRTMCATHFEERYVLAHRLTQSAIPTLNLPGPIDASAYMNKYKEECAGRCKRIGGMQATPSQPVHPTIGVQHIQPADHSLPSAATALDMGNTKGLSIAKGNEDDTATPTEESSIGSKNLGQENEAVHSEPESLNDDTLEPSTKTSKNSTHSQEELIHKSKRKKTAPGIPTGKLKSLRMCDRLNNEFIQSNHNR